MVNRLDDQEVDMDAFYAGSKEIFQALFQSYCGPLRRFAGLYITAQLEKEDIVAEAFYQLFHHRENCHTVTAIEVYLFSKVAELSNVRSAGSESGPGREPNNGPPVTTLLVEFPVANRTIVAELFKDFPPKYGSE